MLRLPRNSINPGKEETLSYLSQITCTRQRDICINVSYRTKAPFGPCNIYIPVDLSCALAVIVNNKSHDTTPENPFISPIFRGKETGAIYAGRLKCSIGTIQLIMAGTKCAFRTFSSLI